MQDNETQAKASRSVTKNQVHKRKDMPHLPKSSINQVYAVIWLNHRQFHLHSCGITVRAPGKRSTCETTVETFGRVALQVNQ